MRSACVLETVATIGTRCTGANAVDCGVTMSNKQNFPLIPGKLEIVAGKHTFYKQ